jgi:hypothetical protein
MATTSLRPVGNLVGSLSRGNRPSIDTLPPPRDTRATPLVESRLLAPATL